METKLTINNDFLVVEYEDTLDVIIEEYEDIKNLIIKIDEANKIIEFRIYKSEYSYKMFEDYLSINNKKVCFEIYEPYLEDVYGDRTRNCSFEIKDIGDSNLTF